jgi:acyl-CoA thioesterase I
MRGFMSGVIMTLALNILYPSSDAHAMATQQEKPMIVVALGTSLTHRGGWLKPLEQHLSSCLGVPVRVLDFGRSGETSAWGLTVISEVIDADPDVVLIEFSVNDAAWFKGFSLQHSRENTTKIVQAILKAKPQTKIFLMTMSPSFGLHGWIRWNVDAYFDLYEPLARELGVGYIDNRPSWKRLTKEELRSGIPDGAHPSPELAARLLVPTISKAIAGRDCKATPGSP